MKLLWFLALCCLEASATFQSTCHVLSPLCLNGCTIPQLDVPFACMDKISCMSAWESAKSHCKVLPNPVKFCLTTSTNQTGCEMIDASRESIDNSSFDPSLPVIFYVHGYTQCFHCDVNQQISDAFLDHGRYNVINVIWCRACADYFTAACADEKVGEVTAALIDLMTVNYAVADVRVVGHSLGAHIAGRIGRSLKNSRLNVIYGLDPAGPLFSYNSPTQRLTSDDANEVIVFHSNSGTLGMTQAIGHVDLYFNGGSCQPDCGVLDIGSCSHNCAHAYLIAAIRGDNMPVTACNNYQYALAHNCTSSSNINLPDVLNSSGNITGVFYVAVDKANNYCKAASLSNIKYVCAGLD